jgi:hypothetical protein
MYNNVQQQLRQIAEQYASPRSAIFDYGTGAALGALGQQGLNAVTDGSDPNAILSGLMYAPIYRGNKQVGRASQLALNEQKFMGGIADANLDQQAAMAKGLQKYAFGSPLEASLSVGSNVGMLASQGTSAYNVLTGGEDYDNNIPASLAALAAIAPTAFYLLKNRVKSGVPF